MFLKARYCIVLIYILFFGITSLLGNYTALGECTGDGVLCMSKAFVILVILNGPGILAAGILGIQHPLFVILFSLCIYGGFGYVVDASLSSIRKNTTRK